MHSKTQPLQLSFYSLLEDTAQDLYYRMYIYQMALRKLPTAMAHDNTWSCWPIYLTEPSIDFLESRGTGLCSPQPSMTHSHPSYLQTQTSCA